MSREPTRAVRRLKLTRRQLLQAMQVAGVAGAGVGLGLVGFRGEAEASEVDAVCRLCAMRCELHGKVEGDRLVKVEGAEGSKMGGFACMHAHALPQIVHASERVRRPLLRRGDAFEEVTWDDALAFLAERMLAIREKHGARAVAVQTGWPFVRHRMVGVLQRFCQAFGTPNLATVASLCEASGRMGKALTCGSKFWADINHSRTLVVWGANPSASAPPYARMVRAMATHGHNLIVIDSTRTELADRAQLFLQPRPGTDTALALGMMRVILDEGWHDEAFVSQYVTGLEQLQVHLQDYDLAAVAEITSVSVEKIVQAARVVATQTPTSVWDGLGLEHHENGVQAVRAVACLQAICGQLDGKGNAVLYTPAREDFWDETIPALYRLHTPEPVPPPVVDAPIGHHAHPLYTVFNRQAQAATFADAILKDEPYPLRGLILVGSNALYTSAGSRRMREAAQKLELLVSVDPVLSPSGEFADLVLPAATFAEPAMVPLQHQARTEYAIFADLAKRLGIGEYFPWPTLDAMMAVPSVRYMRDSAVEISPDPRARPASGKPPRFPSRSGKVELYSETMLRFGYPPLPTWKAPSESLSREFPFRLLTGPRTVPYINSQFRHVNAIRQKLPSPVALIHPEAARRVGLTDGEMVRVTSPHGVVTIELSVSDRVHPEVVVLPAGWVEPSINDLIGDATRDPVSGFPAFRSSVCGVETASDAD